MHSTLNFLAYWFTYSICHKRREGGLERGVRERYCDGFTKKGAENKRKIGDEKRWERTGEGHARDTQERGNESESDKWCGTLDFTGKRV